MLPTEPLPLHHSWPLVGDGSRFDLGRVLTAHDARAIDPGHDMRLLQRPGPGRWHCNLTDNSLTWSPEIYDLFGFPRDTVVSRAASVARYGEPSRAAMERLRAYAIRHRRGFTLDTEIFTAGGDRRWVRLVAAPVCDDGRVVALRGWKWDVSGLYI